jgi:predicted ATPase
MQTKIAHCDDLIGSSSDATTSPVPVFQLRRTSRSCEVTNRFGSVRTIAQLAAGREAPERDNDPMPRRAWDAPLVGRAAELAMLDEAMRAAADGSPAVVLIAGEAGIGKSRLTAAAANRARADSWQVLNGGCLDLAEGSVPYLPLMDALHDLPADTLPPLLTGWLRGLADEASHQHSEDAARGRIYAAYLEVLRTCSLNSPLALVVEDLHWADRGTRDLLSYLVRALTAPTARARLLIILTYRSDEFPRGSPVRRWLGELARRPSVSRVDVAPLDRAEVGQQLTALGTFDSHAAQEIFLRSEGNPFYVEELSALWTTGQPRVPEVVRDAADVRVASLPADDLDVVRVLAALGRPATFKFIQMLSGRPPTELLATLRRAVEAGLFTVDAQTAAYRFRHSLLAQAVTSDFLPGERASLHQVIARSLANDSALSTGPGEVGYHQAVTATSKARCSLIWRPLTPQPGSMHSAMPANSSSVPSSSGAGSLTRSGAQASLEPTC